MIVIFDIVESGIYMPMLRDVHDLHDLLRFFLIATSWTLVQDLQHHRERDAELLQQARQRQIFWFDLLIPIRFHHFHHLLHLRLFTFIITSTFLNWSRYQTTADIQRPSALVLPWRLQRCWSWSRIHVSRCYYILICLMDVSSSRQLRCWQWHGQRLGIG